MDALLQFNFEEVRTDLTYMRCQEIRDARRQALRCAQKAAKVVALEERGNQLCCESVWIVDILDIKIDWEVCLTRPIENVSHDARLSKTARRYEVNVVSCQELPDALDEVFTPEQLVGFRYAPGEASNSHVE